MSQPSPQRRRTVFQDFWRVFAEGATYLQDEWSDKLFGFLAALVDMGCEAARIASRAHLLLDPDSPPDALAPIGRERGLERAPGEGLAEYRTRLHEAWEIWADAGTRAFAYRALEALGLTSSDVTVYYSADPDIGVPYDGVYWSTCWVYIGDAAAIRRVTAGSGIVCGGPSDISCGWSLSDEQSRYVRRSLRNLKAGHELPMRLFYDPDEHRVCGVGALCGGAGFVAGNPQVELLLSRLCGDDPHLVAGGGHHDAITQPLVCGAII